MAIVRCPGCAIEREAPSAALQDKWRASAACWNLYCDLAAYNMARREPSFLHQEAVDAYAAQHSGHPTRAITTVFGVAGLYLFVDCGFTGRQVQRAHVVMGRRRRTWPEWRPPADPGEITVARVLAEPEGAARDGMIRRWAEEQWQLWQHERRSVQELCHELLDVEPR